MLLERLAKHWWVFVVRGVLAILFGIGAFFWPGITVAALILVFGAYALADGVFSLIAAFANRGTREGFPWALLLIGLVGIGAGIVTFLYPGLTALALLFFIATWNILRGIFEIVVAIRLRKELEGEGWLMLGGAASVAFGLLLMLRPGAGALALLWLIGMFAIAFGIVMVALGFRLKGATRRVPA
jgi:uncharacterized membrane protein HdeD (DUF308 family)